VICAEDRNKNQVERNDLYLKITISLNRKAGELMRMSDFTFGMTRRAGEVANSKIPSGITHRTKAMAGLPLIPQGALITMAACLFSGCTTGPGSTTDTTPPTPSWSLADQTSGNHLDGIVPAGSSITIFINPGDNYIANFTATSSAGIKSITLSGSGEVICHNNQPPYNEAKPYKYTIPAQTITLGKQPDGTFFTQAFNPFFFFWAPTKGEPAANAPASSAWKSCGDQVPLLGTTTYTGQATTEAGVSNPATSLMVTTCAAGLGSSPKITCP
jgi:hypothetical protein